MLIGDRGDPPFGGCLCVPGASGSLCVFSARACSTAETFVRRAVPLRKNRTPAPWALLHVNPLTFRITWNAFEHPM